MQSRADLGAQPGRLLSGTQRVGLARHTRSASAGVADESSSCSSLRVSHLASVRLGKPKSANATLSVACGGTTRAKWDCRLFSRAKWDCRLFSHTVVTYLTPADTLVTLETNGGTPFGTLPLLRYRSTAESSYLSAVSQWHSPIRFNRLYAESAVGPNRPSAAKRSRSAAN